MRVPRGKMAQDKIEYIVSIEERKAYEEYLKHIRRSEFRQLLVVCLLTALLTVESIKLFR